LATVSDTVVSSPHLRVGLVGLDETVDLIVKGADVRGGHFPWGKYVGHFSEKVKMSRIIAG